MVIRLRSAGVWLNEDQAGHDARPISGPGFGPERLIYASNWPVSERFAPLATVQGIVGDYFGSYGHQAEEKVFSHTPKAAYRRVQRENPTFRPPHQ
jgi:predicted TIM-barrel fold metal-dependent hydrolase